MPSNYILVTGASGGIGGAIARELSRSANLILCGRRQERLESVRATCQNADAHLIWTHDLSEVAPAGLALASLIAQREIGVEGFVHAAGVFDFRPLRSVDWSSAQNMFNVNLFAAIELVRQLSRKRINGDALRNVTFISSIATRVGAPGYHLYAASKGALNALSRALAVELAPAVRVNCVLPGAVETEATQAIFSDAAAVDRMNAATPLGAGAPADVARVVAFLASDASRWITGQEFVVDGGRSII